MWSQKNVETVARLIADGRMRPAGLAQVEAAQADGRWDRAYAGSATITVPDDLAAALAAEPAAEAFFATLDKANRYAVLWRVHTAATAGTRANRIAACVQMLAEGRRIHGEPACPRRADAGGVPAAGDHPLGTPATPRTAAGPSGDTTGVAARDQHARQAHRHRAPPRRPRASPPR